MRLGDRPSEILARIGCMAVHPVEIRDEMELSTSYCEGKVKKEGVGTIPRNETTALATLDAETRQVSPESPR